jgi:DNA-directed RNA polymerase specialized sigma54-like protein
MIPYHIVDLQTYPTDVIDIFSKGCFFVSISCEYCSSVALDEAHEMEINLKTKNALNSFNLSSLATLTYYLPYSAETLHNVKTQLLFQ